METEFLRKAAFPKRFANSGNESGRRLETILAGRFRLRVLSTPKAFQLSAQGCCPVFGDYPGSKEIRFTLKGLHLRFPKDAWNGNCETSPLLIATTLSVLMPREPTEGRPEDGPTLG